MISIIIPIFNAEKYIERCLDSVQQQTYKNYECLLIDDGSTDRSAEICKKLAEQDTRFKYYYKENSGVSSTRNYGLGKATGQYITFIDSDDFVEPNMLQLFVSGLTENDADMVQVGFTHSMEKIGIVEMSNVNILLKEEIMGTYFSSKEKMYPCVCGGFFVRDKISKLCFNENLKYGEDFLFLANYLYQCNKVVVIDSPTYHYVLNESSATQSKNKNTLKKVKDTIESLEHAYELCDEKEQYYILQERVFKGLLSWIFYQSANRKITQRSNEINIYLSKKITEYENSIQSNPYIKKKYKKCVRTGIFSIYVLSAVSIINKIIEKLWRSHK